MKIEPRDDDVEPRAKPNGTRGSGATPGQPGKPPAVRRVAPPANPPTRFRFVRLLTAARRRLGAVLLGTVILAVILYLLFDRDTRNLTVVHGYGGAIKGEFFKDPEIIDILADSYGLKVDLDVRGSVALACGTPYGPNDDFVWLGDSVALNIYLTRGCNLIESSNIYQSPIVLYSWAPIVDALQTIGLVHEANGVYTIDIAGLIDLMAKGTAWAAIGVPDLYGRIQVHTTDPNESNSGLLFAGLLANVMNGGQVVDDTTVRPLLPDLRRYFGNLGFMPTKSGDLFGQLMTMGMGANPLVALYESQGLEYVIALGQQGNQAQIDQVTQQLRILYPEPTVWANHPFAARTEAGRDLMRALLDPEIQRLAWENHGQRPGVAGVSADPTAIPWTGIKQDILSVTPMPKAATMQLILDAIAPLIGGVSPTGAGATPIAPTSAAAVIPPTSTAAPRRIRRGKWPPIRRLA